MLRTRNHFLSIAVWCIGVHAACAQPQEAKALLDQIRTTLAGHAGTFAVAYKDAQTGEQILLHEREVFHAASTMKTPVMIEVFRKASAGQFKLTDSILIKNEFKSIVDGSPYSLHVADDSEPELYGKVGQRLPLYDVMYQMIIASSNLATNLIIEWVDARDVTHTMRTLGAMDIEVRRGVEDSKAFAKGLNNTVTAFDLMILFDQMARGKIVDAKACEQMMAILLDQKFNEIIPAKLPQGVKVAHKTGSIRGVQHDSGIVILPDGRRYSLVLLSKNLRDEPAAIEAMATVSRLIYDYANRAR
ncbi:MAG: serine hydrolase [Cyclobacteriaceae bacterium]|nr:serine hydrolase [Cyclobacteriaceae bacterium]